MSLKSFSKPKAPSSEYLALLLQGVLDKIRLKIQKLEKAIADQHEHCSDPCTTKCPIPVVSGKVHYVDTVHKSMVPSTAGEILQCKILSCCIRLFLMQGSIILYLSGQVGNVRTFTAEEEKIPSCT